MINRYNIDKNMISFRHPRSNPRDNMLVVQSNGERVGNWSIMTGAQQNPG